MPRRELVSRDPQRMALAGEAVEYLLVRRRGRRGVGLKVDENGLTVSAPSTMALAKIEALVRESERWILRKIAEWSTRRVAPPTWRDGDRLPYLGGHLVLRVRAGSRAVALARGGELHVTAPEAETAGVRRAVVAWYRRAAREHFVPRVESLARAAGLPAPRVFVSPATARWGSCNTRREIRLAWRLMKAPAQLVDYVICHELAHMRHMNHSNAFWSEVARQCPEYKRLRAELFATDHLYRSF
jgi:hypothetical protein